MRLTMGRSDLKVVMLFVLSVVFGILCGANTCQADEDRLTQDEMASLGAAQMAVAQAELVLENAKLKADLARAGIRERHQIGVGDKVDDKGNITRAPEKQAKSEKKVKK